MEVEERRADREDRRTEEQKRRPHEGKKNLSNKQSGGGPIKNNNTGWRPSKDSYQAEWPHLQQEQLQG